MPSSRRVPCVVIGLALLLSACGWPMWGYGPARTNHNPLESRVAVENVANLQEVWRTTVGSRGFGPPTVDRGVLYATVTHNALTAGELHAFDASGKTNCSGDPKVCSPLWSASPFGVVSPATIVGGVAYVGAADGFDAFDAAGTSNCSGTPKVCQPLWRGVANSGNLFAMSSPALANGILFASLLNKLYAFDAAGEINCSGTPKLCAPLWTIGPLDGALTPPAIADGRVFVASSVGSLYVFDAAGMTNCSGSPKTCTPLWTATIHPTLATPTVADGKVYVVAVDQLYVFDAAGVTSCAGTPRMCTPLWTAPVYQPADGANPAVADGMVYISAIELQAFDGAGQQNCSGNPRTCLPLWKANAGAGFRGSPTIANGVVYINTNDPLMLAFDASGDVGCTGSPKVCTALWADAAGSSIAVANGTIYVNGGAIHAYSLP